MKSVQKIDLGLTGYDELFMNDAERKENKLPRIYDIPLSEIDDFPDHPFKVKLDEDMDQLVQSVTERGIITPITLRQKEDGRYAYANFHEKFIKGHITLVGCPKLDSVDYSEKLTEIIKGNDIKSVTVVRMEVPCCGGLENAVKAALQNSGKFIPWQVITLSTDGDILD